MDDDDQEINVDTDSRCSADDASHTSSLVDGVGRSPSLSPGDMSAVAQTFYERRTQIHSRHSSPERSPTTRLEPFYERRSDERSMSPSPPPSSTSSNNGQSLPFSISRLLGKDIDVRRSVVDKEKYNQAEMMQNESLLYAHPALMFNRTPGLCVGTYGGGLVYNTAAGVIRVPAHRPGGLPPPGGPGAGGFPAGHFPWLPGMDHASLQRSAAAAAFASQVVKERLTGKEYWKLAFNNFKLS